MPRPPSYQNQKQVFTRGGAIEIAIAGQYASSQSLATQLTSLRGVDVLPRSPYVGGPLGMECRAEQAEMLQPRVHLVRTAKMAHQGGPPERHPQPHFFEYDECEHQTQLARSYMRDRTRNLTKHCMSLLVRGRAYRYEVRPCRAKMRAHADIVKV